MEEAMVGAGLAACCAGALEGAACAIAPAERLATTRKQNILKRFIWNSLLTLNIDTWVNFVSNNRSKPGFIALRDERLPKGT
jgi:hypothetical protein